MPSASDLRVAAGRAGPLARVFLAFPLPPPADRTQARFSESSISSRELLALANPPTPPPLRVSAAIHLTRRLRGTCGLLCCQHSRRGMYCATVPVHQPPAASDNPCRRRRETRHDRLNTSRHTGSSGPISLPGSESAARQSGRFPSHPAPPTSPYVRKTKEELLTRSFDA